MTDQAPRLDPLLAVRVKRGARKLYLSHRNAECRRRSGAVIRHDHLLLMAATIASAFMALVFIALLCAMMLSSYLTSRAFCSRRDRSYGSSSSWPLLARTAPSG
jgi:hypothetical protein